MLSPHSCRSLSVVAGILALAAFTVCGSAGCSLLSTRYTPRSLPPEFQAKDVHKAQNLDISHFVHRTTENDRIKRGDLLKVTLAAGLDADAVTELRIRVNDNGTCTLPEIGPLPLAGLSLMQADQQITAACVNRQLYRRPLVTVIIEEQRANRITVAGAVKTPSVQELSRKSSYLLDAIMAAGGFAEDAGTRITIRRPAGPSRLAAQESALPGGSGVQLAGATQEVLPRQPQLVCLDLADVRTSADRGEYLPDGSVITVERLRPEPIQVIGLVEMPGQYDYPLDHDLHVFGAIALAGGLTSNLANEVLVIRKNPDSDKQIAIRVDLKAAKRSRAANLKLAPGDIVSVEPNVGTVLTDIPRLFGIGGSARNRR